MPVPGRVTSGPAARSVGVVRTCASCGAPFGPGDRRCGRCGVARDGSTPPGAYGAYGAASGVSSAQSRAWSGLSQPAPGGDIADDTADDGEVRLGETPGHPRRLARRAGAIAAVTAIGVIGVVGAALADRTGPVIVHQGPWERVLPAPLTAAPSLRWRAAGLGASAPGDQGYGDGRALVDQDATHVYAIAGSAPRTLTALDLVDGRPAWSASLPGPAIELGVVGDTVYVGTDAGLAAFDGRTGGRRWWTTDAETFLFSWPGGPLAGFSFADGRRIRSVLDPATGRARWSIAAVGAEPTRPGMVVATSCRRVELRAWSDGHVVWTHDTEEDECPGFTVSVAGAGDTIVVMVAQAWIGLDAANGAQRWRVGRDGGESESLIPLDDAHVVVSADASFQELRDADLPPGRLIDTDTGDVRATDIDREAIVRVTRHGEPEQVYAYDGTVLRTLDRRSFTFVAPSTAMYGELRSSTSVWALAVDTAYSVSGVSGRWQLVATSITTGAVRWSGEVPEASELASVGRVLLVVAGGDLVAYG